MNGKVLVVLMVVSAAAVVAAVVALRGERPGAGDAAEKSVGNPVLLPGLAEQVDKVRGVQVVSAEGTSTVRAVEGGGWMLEDKANYPVDAAKVREVVLVLAGLNDLEPRTSDPARYKEIGVEEPAAKTDAGGAEAGTAGSSRAALVKLMGQDGQPIASVIIGNSKPLPGGVQGVYIRKADAAESYLANLGARRFDVPRKPLDWLDKQFLDVTRDRVWSVAVTPAESAGGEAERVVASRSEPTAAVFAVLGVPEGRELKNPGLAESLASGLAQVAFEDVAAAESIDFAGEHGGVPGPSVRVRTWDGLIVEIRSVEVDGKTWWKLEAAADPEPWMEAPAPQPPGEDGTTAPVAEPKPRRTPEAVAEEVASLNKKWGGWAFAPFSYKAGAFKVRMSEQLNEPAASAPAPGASAEPMPAPQ